MTITRAQVTLLLGALALIHLGFAAALIWPSYVTATVTGQIPDFSAFWAAGVLTLEGAPALAYDWPSHRAAQVTGLGRDFDGWMPWHYPPTAQLLVTPLGLVPLFPAMIGWLALTGALFLWTCWCILPDRNAVLAGLAAAPTALTLVNGQMGFLLAAVMGLALLQLGHNRAGAGTAAGALLALLSIKPHLVAPGAPCSGGGGSLAGDDRRRLGHAGPCGGGLDGPGWRNLGGLRGLDQRDNGSLHRRGRRCATLDHGRRHLWLAALPGGRSNRRNPRPGRRLGDGSVADHPRLAEPRPKRRPEGRPSCLRLLGLRAPGP